MEKCRAKGLCFNCNEKFYPGPHCKRKQYSCDDFPFPLLGPGPVDTKPSPALTITIFADTF